MKMEETDSAIEDAETKLQICSRKKRKLQDYLVETQHNSDIVQRYTEMLTKDKESNSYLQYILDYSYHYWLNL